MRKHVLSSLVILLMVQLLPAQNNRARKAGKLISNKGIEVRNIIEVMGIPTVVVMTELAEVGELKPAIGFLYGENDRKKTGNLRRVTTSLEEIEAFLSWYEEQVTFPLMSEVPEAKLNKMGWGDMVYLMENPLDLAVSGMTYFPRFVEERKKLKD